MITRTCRNGQNCVCGPIPQPLDKEHFWTDKRAAGGFRETCKACTVAKAKATSSAGKPSTGRRKDPWNDNADPVTDEVNRLRENMTVRCGTINALPEGQEVVLKVRGSGQGGRASVVQCKLIGKYRSVFTVDLGAYRESFPIADLVCGRIELMAAGR